MSAVAAPSPSRLSGRGPGRALQPSVGVAIRLVAGWHALAALGCGWILWNIAGAVWQLESLPRTAIGIAATIEMVIADPTIDTVGSGATRDTVVVFVAIEGVITAAAFNTVGVAVAGGNAPQQQGGGSP